MSPLVRIFKDVHIKIMTSQTQPAQGTRSIQKSFFTGPFQFCFETPEGATGRHDTPGERARRTQGRLGRRQHPAALVGCHSNGNNRPQPTEKVSVGKWSWTGTPTAAASGSSAPRRCFAKTAARPTSGSSSHKPLACRHDPGEPGAIAAARCHFQPPKQTQQRSRARNKSK